MPPKPPRPGGPGGGGSGTASPKQMQPKGPKASPAGSPAGKKKPPTPPKSTKAKAPRGMAVGRGAAEPSTPSIIEPETPSKPKGAPKTLREVATFYEFPLDAVREANPSLSELGDDDRIPKGTKLALPKKSKKLSSASDAPKSPLEKGLGAKGKSTLSAMDVVKQKQEEARKKAREKELAREAAEAAAFQEQESEEEFAKQSAFGARVPESQAAIARNASASIRSPGVASPGGKKKPPKTLGEVAENYNFTLKEVMDANPTLAHLGPDDKIPIGTKLQLPKRKPTFAQLSAQLALHESQQRQLVAMDYDKESDNFFFLLRTEKKQILRQHEEQMGLWKKHEAIRQELLKERTADLKEYAVDEYERRLLLVTRRCSSDEAKARLVVTREYKDDFAVIEAMDVFFRGTIDDLYKDMAATDAEEDTAYAGLQREEQLFWEHLSQRSALEQEHIRSLPSVRDEPEAAERATIHDLMMADRKRVEAYLIKWYALNDAQDAGRASIDATEEPNGRTIIEELADAGTKHIAKLYASRGDFEAQCVQERHLMAQEETKERNAHAATLKTWTKKMEDAAEFADKLFKDEADDERTVTENESCAREATHDRMMKHRAWTQTKLDAQTASYAAEDGSRGDIYTTWAEALRVILLAEIPPRVDRQHDESRVPVEADESEDREHLMSVASQMHEAAAHFHSETESLVAEAYSTVPHHHEKVLESFLDEYDRCSTSLVTDEADSRRNGPLADEIDARTGLNRGVQDLNTAARRFIAEEARIVKEQDDAAWAIQQDEDGTWERMLKWGSRRVEMIELGKTELEFLEMEEDHERTEVASQRDQDRLRISALKQDHLAYTRQLLDEQSEMYYMEHKARKDVSGLEAKELDELRDLQREDGRRAWKEYMDRMFDELVANIVRAEEQGRPDVEADETGVRADLTKAKAQDKSDAEAEEAARLVRERLLRELLERQRKERLLLERACESQRDTTDYEWRCAAFAIAVEMGCVAHEAQERIELDELEESAAFDQLLHDCHDGVQVIERQAVEDAEAEARAPFWGEEQEGFDEWRRVRLAEHYEIWLVEEAERLRIQAQDRQDICDEEERARKDELDDALDAAWEQFLLDEIAGVKEAHRLEAVHAEELRRAIEEWKERMWFARKSMGDDEKQLRDDEMLIPESAQWIKMMNAEGRSRRKAAAEHEARVQRETEAEEQRRAAEEARREAERKERQRAIEAELAREREKERQKLLKRQGIQRDRMEEKESAKRGDIDRAYDDWHAETAASMEESQHDAHNAAVARDTTSKLDELEAEEAAARADIDAEADGETFELDADLEQQYQDACEEEHQRRLKRVWNALVPVDLIEPIMDLEDDETAARAALTYNWETAFRSWVDAISIEERLIEAEGRRKTTQALLAVNVDEFEERNLLLLLEGMLRVQIEAGLDREVLTDWEVRCTDALHAFAIDTIDSYMIYGAAGHGPVHVEPRCAPRKTFWSEEQRLRAAYGMDPEADEDVDRIPSLAMSSMALTPRPPPVAACSIATTPARLRERVRNHELRGEAGTPKNLLAKMRRFDEECRSELSTPFSSPGNYGRSQSSNRLGYSTHTPGEVLPTLMPSPTPVMGLIEDVPSDVAASGSPLNNTYSHAFPRPPPGSAPQTSLKKTGRPPLPGSRLLPGVGGTPAAYRRHRTASSGPSANTTRPASSASTTLPAPPKRR